MAPTASEKWRKLLEDDFPFEGEITHGHNKQTLKDQTAPKILLPSLLTLLQIQNQSRRLKSVQNPQEITLMVCLDGMDLGSWI